MTNCWHLDASIARLEHPQLAGVVDLQRPDRGLHDLTLAGESLTGSLLAVEVDNSPDGNPEATHQTPHDGPRDVSDAYVRAEDLVAVYEPTKLAPFRWQVDWRVHEATPDALATIDLVVSMQTPLLATRPRVTICSQIASERASFFDAAGRECRDDQCALVVLQPGGALQLIEMVHPTDHGDVQVERNEADRIETTWQVGEPLLEKGVVRRIRVRTVALPANAAAKVAVEQLAKFAAEPPPLTV